jgi:hypothetical protein
MQGVAQSVNSIALQADIFSKSNVIASPIFSNIARASDGVHFDFTGVVNPTALNYASFVATASTPVNTTQTAPAQAQPSSTNSNPSSSTGNPFGTSGATTQGSASPSTQTGQTGEVPTTTQ